MTEYFLRDLFLSPALDTATYVSAFKLHLGISQKPSVDRMPAQASREYTHMSRGMRAGRCGLSSSSPRGPSTAKDLAEPPSDLSPNRPHPPLGASWNTPTFVLWDHLLNS